MDKLNYIIFIQMRFKFLYKLKTKKINLYNDIFSHITKLSERNETNDQLKIISNYTYNILNIELSKILETYNLIAIDSNTIQTIIKLNNIKNELKKLVNKIGTKSFNDIIYFYFNINENYIIKNNLKEQFIFLNKYFNPTKIMVYNKNTNPSHEYDNIDNTHIIQYIKLKKKNITLYEHINGCNIYLKINGETIIITGYFISDSLNSLRQTNVLKDKYNEILEKSTNLNIDTNFKYNYIEQLSVRDYFIYTSSQIIENIQKNYFKIINYHKNNISYIVKDFLNKNIKEQLEIIVLLLLIKNNEIQYIAYLLYDLINNDSYLLKSQYLSDQIYNNLHWTLQKNFKNNINKIEEKIKDINFNLEEIPYEKRIYLMQCNDSTKHKAIEKYKEVINKSNENSSKSQQYLDSILKIPFNIYKKEQILYLKDHYELKIINIVSQVNNYINENNINYPLLKTSNLPSYLYIDMVDIINKLEVFNNLNNNILDKYIKKNKNKDITTIIESINSDQHILNFKTKGTKKELLQTFNNFFSNNNITENLKTKYYNIINIKSNPLNLKINLLLNDWNSFKNKRKKYIENIDDILNQAIYSQNDAKNEIKRIIGQWINGKMTGYCLGFEGPPGIGKTSLAKKGISKCLIDENGESRPFSFIALGGSSNGSLLEGHNYTYVGSNYGKIIDILIQTKCMNPIIYIDELDKISNTENGKEIIGILTHLTDFSQNDKFSDKYFSGIEFDLSKVLFIFSYNDYNKLDPILADRIHRIKFNYLQKYEKIYIMNNYIIPELLNNIGYSKENIIFSDDVISYIIDNYTYEAGVRKIKEKIFEIIREINLDGIMTNSNNTKITINLDYVKQLFANKPQVYQKKINEENLVGVVNGLYATSLGIGGIITIQVTKSFNDKKLEFTITGQQGDVMKESIYCSKTVAWGLLPEDIKNSINSDKSFGIHLHCPEASTPKDGPSAGGALTLAILSLLTNIKVKRDVGLTGEIDLKGNITKIGGLDLKIEGGKQAGLKTILIPLENKLDYDIIKKENPQILDNINIIIVSSINEIVQLCLEENNIIFNL
jgi:ATP-dependent Lon protease